MLRFATRFLTKKVESWSKACRKPARTCRKPDPLLYTSLRHSQPTSFTVNHSTSPDRTKCAAQHFRSSGLLLQVRRSGTRYRTVSVTRRSPATASNNRWRRICFVVTTQHTQRIVEMLHDSALYKSIIDIDIDIRYRDCELSCTQTEWQNERKHNSANLGGVIINTRQYSSDQ